MKNCIVAQHEQTYNQKMLAEKHNDEKLAIKLLIVGAWMMESVLPSEKIICRQ